MVSTLPDVAHPVDLPCAPDALGELEAPDEATARDPLEPSEWMPLDDGLTERARLEPGPWRRILVPYDGSPLSGTALRPAANLARSCGATIHLAHAVHPARVPGVSRAIGRAVWETNGRVLLAAAADQIAASGAPGIPVREVLIQPRPDEEADAPTAILTALRAARADLVVMATHGRTGAARAVIGSVAEEVARRAGVAVLLFGRGAARAAETWPASDSALPTSVLVALSGDAVAEAVLEPAVALAEALGAGIELVRVLPENRLLLGSSYGAHAAARGAQIYLSGQTDELLEAHPLLPFVRTAALVADPNRVAATIAEHARWSGACAIAMATHGRSGLARLLLGSVTTGVVAEASVPVLVAPPVRSSGAASRG